MTLRPETLFPDTTPLFPPETRTVRGITFHNFSGQNLDVVAFKFFPRDLRASQATLLPDLNPGKSPLPTGCCVEIDEAVQPDWRRFAISDVGCGMLVVRSGMKWEEFEAKKYKWDAVGRQLQKNRASGNKKAQLGDMGGGNHFGDAMVDDAFNVYFNIHTGSRDESPKAKELVDQPAEFDATYEEIKAWAKANRQAIADIMAEQYGDLEIVLDRTHNFYIKQPGKVKIYKGSVRLNPGDLTIIPSSMDGDMAIVTGKPATADYLRCMAHGTGRIDSTGDSKIRTANFNYDALRKRISIPDFIEDTSMRNENPDCYRKLDDCLRLVDPLVTVVKRLHTIAYLGGL